jgi:putative membrane protein
MSDLTKYSILTLKGIGIGMANVIPGVSGGTIAFLTGIYEN